MMAMINFLNDGATVGFYALAAVAIIASLRVVMHPNPVHAILAMIVSLLAVAGIFFILGAPFAGALEVIVYAGAILVLFVFVIMMLNLGQSDVLERTRLTASTWAVPTGIAIVVALLLYAMIGLGAGEPDAVLATQVVSAKAVGTALFSDYISLVQVAALLLLAALVAAYHLGKKALDDENFSHSSMRTEEETIDPTDLPEVEKLQQLTQAEGDYQYQPVRADEFTREPPKEIR